MLLVGQCSERWCGGIWRCRLGGFPFFAPEVDVREERCCGGSLLICASVVLIVTLQHSLDTCLERGQSHSYLSEHRVIVSELLDKVDESPESSDIVGVVLMVGVVHWKRCD